MQEYSRSVHVPVLINAKRNQSIPEILDPITQVIMEIVTLEAVHVELDSEPRECDFIAYVCEAFELFLKDVEIVGILEKGCSALAVRKSEYFRYPSRYLESKNVL